MLGDWQRRDVFNSAHGKNPPKHMCQRDNKLTCNMCEIAGVQLSKDKVYNYPHLAGMNRSEMNGVTVNSTSRISKHDTNNELNSS